MREPLEERIAAMVEAAAEEVVADRTRPTQEFCDELRELRQQLEMSVEEFSTTYGVSTEEIRVAELARGVKPSTAWALLVAMIKVDPKGTADVVANAKKKNG